MSRHYHSLLNVLTSAAFSYAKSSYHQDEADPTPTITGTPGGTFSATPSGLSINASTGTIDLSASTIQPYTITYTVSGVSANFSLSVTASPFLANTYSMQFDGVNDYITVGSGFQYSDLTISGWLYADSISTFRRIIQLGRSSGGIGFGVAWENSSKLIAFWNNGTETVRLGNTSLSTGNWYHFAMTRNSSEVKIYVNGADDSGTGGQTGWGSSNNDLEIGRKAGGGQYFNGKIDEIAIWNTVLSADAITDIYNATNNNSGKALDLSTDSGNYTNSSSLQYWNRLSD